VATKSKGGITVRTDDTSQEPSAGGIIPFLLLRDDDQILPAAKGFFGAEEET
jgi:hypothetical protein